MGSFRLEDQPRKLMLLVLLTNLLTIYILISPTKLNSYFHHHSFPLWDHDLSSATTTVLLRELNKTRSHLAASHSEAADLQRKLTSTNLLVQALLIELTKVNESKLTTTSEILIERGGATEVSAVLGPHKLPSAYPPRSRSDNDDVYPSFGAGCLNYKEDLIKYLSYEVGEESPMDDALAHKLMLKGCDPLSRRRCRPISQNRDVGLTPLLKSQWVTLPDTTSVKHETNTCKHYKCLIDKAKSPKFHNCKDCFNKYLQGREIMRWDVDKGLDYGIDQVLATRPPGTVRIGLDIEGGPGTFAAQMRDKNVTIVTTTMSLDSPFNSLMSSRGLVSIHVSKAQRLPFSDNTLDIVHYMHVLSNRIPRDMLEFTLYDIYRVIRPGGLFWLDHFFCQGGLQLNDTYIPMIERVGFRKIRWDVGKKLGRGVHKDEWYLSALLEKPVSSSG